MNPPLVDTLKDFFGYDAFRGNQQEIIETLLKGNDVFCVQPTGSGKSLLYQLPALISRGTAVVISPLKALQLDQVNYLTMIGIKAVGWNSSIDPTEAENELKKEKPDIKMIFTTPESILNNSRLSRCLSSLHRRTLISFFAIDESHCISQWGQGFRPEYSKLGSIRVQYPGIPIIALTATATPFVQREIITSLSLRPIQFISSFNRPEIRYEVRTCIDPTADILLFLRANKTKKGIIYTNTQKRTEKIAGIIRKQKYRSKAYHAGLGDIVRASIQQEWQSGLIDVLVATCAFGMGISSNEMRFVIHEAMPPSIEDYYQESGRAGRDGRLATSIVYYSTGKSKQKIMLIKRGNDSNKGILIQKVTQMAKYCTDKGCRRKYLLKHFGDPMNFVCTGCDKCGMLGGRSPTEGRESFLGSFFHKKGAQ